MTSQLIGLWVWPAIFIVMGSLSVVPPSERAMQKRCAGVGEELIQEIHNFALKTAANTSMQPGGGSHGAVITYMRQWVKDKKLTDRVSDKCLAEIVRLAYADNVKDQKAKQEAAAKARQIAAWNALNATEKSWVLRTHGTVPILSCKTLAVGAVGILKNQVNVLHVDSRDGGFAIGGLMCDPIVTTAKIEPSYSGGGSIGTLPASGFRNGPGASGSVIGPQRFDRYETTTTTPPDVRIWISGMDVKSLTTGAKWDLSGKAFEVTGTRTSVDELGGGTIFEVRSVPVDPVLLSTIVPPPGVTIENREEAVEGTPDATRH